MSLRVTFVLGLLCVGLVYWLGAFEYSPLYHIPLLARFAVAHMPTVQFIGNTATAIALVTWGWYLYKASMSNIY